jgi:alkanesulfonate monooxygenase SsuD/methylene tetrahydromethanopterin reductase-like flavin-dependent oxidoreductase (luciferase family)
VPRLRYGEAAGRGFWQSCMRESVLISADPERHAAWLNEYIELGFEELQLHQVGVNQREFIDTFGGKVLPQLRT